MNCNHKLIHDARMKHAEHQLYWAADLMVELEEESPGQALHWAIECMEALVYNSRPTEQETLIQLLTYLSRASKRHADSPSLLNKAQEIWHKERDLLHTAVAHLYAALGYWSQKDIPWYRRSVVCALDVMGDCDFYRASGIAIPIELFGRSHTVN